ncbi:MAG TPA: hypothetical protein VEU62_07445 [Bryobacterales bacterium]|nr:hypothetical protein [Bryobacterales bacterium]
MNRKLLLTIGIFLLAAASLGATMTPRLSLEELVQRSELIVHGRVLRTWSAWDDAHQFIWTHSEIEITEALKGAPGSTIVVSEPGGIVDGVGMWIAGMARYQPGEEMVVFLYKTPIGYWRARGLGQGKFKVEEGAVNGERLVQPALQGVVLAQPIGAPPPAGTDLGRLRGMPLQQFKSQVRSLAALPVQGVK